MDLRVTVALRGMLVFGALLTVPCAAMAAERIAMDADDIAGVVRGRKAPRRAYG